VNDLENVDNRDDYRISILDEHELDEIDAVF
jgi:hypothetical protein